MTSIIPNCKQQLLGIYKSERTMNEVITNIHYGILVINKTNFAYLSSWFLVLKQYKFTQREREKQLNSNYKLTLIWNLIWE